MAIASLPGSTTPRLFVSAAAMLGLVAAAVVATTASAGEPSPLAIEVLGPAAPHAFDGSLAELPLAKKWKPGDPIRVVMAPGEGHQHPSQGDKPAIRASGSGLVSALDQGSTAVSAAATPSASANFDGIDFTGYLPPDTVGDVGPNHYVQMVNSQIAVFSKSGSTLLTPRDISSLWSPSSVCGQEDQGDPVVVYDQYAERWVVSQFNWPDDSEDGPFYLCIAVSKTSDPIAGGWWAYGFRTSVLPDYPKYGVWRDAYYVGTNEPDEAVVAAYAVDRKAMLAGQSASGIRAPLPRLPGNTFQTLLPVDADGPTLPPAGSPGLFMRHVDGEVHGGADRLEIYTLTTDFTAAARASFSHLGDVALASFDSELCASGICIEQPGTSQTLDPLADMLMNRLQYRNLGSREAIVGNFTVDADGQGHAGIRWFELTRSGGAWSIRQQGTHAPDNANRWTGSIAMDKVGDIALGYSVSSPSNERNILPQIRYVAREAKDGNNSLSKTEVTVISSAAPQPEDAGYRWGDYAAMNVDPVDDCTFWFTTEYVGADGWWKTRIVSFVYPSCLSGSGGGDDDEGDSGGCFRSAAGGGLASSPAWQLDLGLLAIVAFLGTAISRAQRRRETP
ncbi:MAG: hypothetical protein HYV63_18695 [Candidatus Schekmanbacteria bacterium]|nr:hypothetical protein [Candidatus Schekmanbacteria bacterium]